MRWPFRWPFPWPKGWRKEALLKVQEPEAEERPRSLRESAVLFARDLAVAFLVVAIFMGALFAYTQVWPPMVVVESNSMQHSDVESFVGVIDTGDLVLVQAVRQAADVVTYVEGRVTGHATYSNYGDVIIFHPPGASLSSTPIIHRAIAYVSLHNTKNPSEGVDVPALAKLPAGEWAGTLTNGMLATQPYGLVRFTLRYVQSWHLGALAREDLTFEMGSVATNGFLTKGDHNPGADNWGQPVSVSRILGKARGEMPWFGLIKLTLAPGATGCCPAGWGDRRAPHNSWDALLVSLILLIAGPFVADFGWAYWKRYRKSKAAKREPSVEEADSVEALAANPGPTVENGDLPVPPPPSDPETESKPRPRRRRRGQG